MLRRHKAAVVIQSRQRGRSARRRYRSDLAAVVRLQMGLRRWQVCPFYNLYTWAVLVALVILSASRKR